MNLEPHALKASADDACALLKALANPHRLMIVCTLIDGEQSVGALAQLLGVRETLASQHLGLLRRDGVVAARRDGQTIYYGLSSGKARALVETLSRLFCTVPQAAPQPAPFKETT
jgi:DNA-binding transcriptional ArsR family regulator